MIAKWRSALRDHWQTWTCLHGWSRLICIADDLAHTLHLPARRLCDLHDRRLMWNPSMDPDPTPQFRCDHMTVSGTGVRAPSCGACGPMRRVA